MQAHAHAAGAGDVGGQRGEDEVAAEDMADQFVHQRMHHQVAKAPAFVHQHPQALIDPAVGGAEGVRAQRAALVHQRLVRATVAKRQSPMFLGVGLLDQPLLGACQGVGIQGVGDQAVTESIQMLPGQIDITGEFGAFRRGHGRYQIGEVKARSCRVVGTSSRGASPRAAAS